MIVISVFISFSGHFFVNVFVLFLRQGLLMFYRLTSNFLGSPGWPWTSNSLPTSSYYLSLQGYITSPLWGSGNETPGFLHARQALYSPGCIFGLCICNLEPYGRFPYSPPPLCERYNVWVCFYPISYCFFCTWMSKSSKAMPFLKCYFYSCHLFLLVQ